MNDDKAQTTLDFIFALVIFLAVVGISIAFAQGARQPPQERVLDFEQDNEKVLNTVQQHIKTNSGAVDPYCTRLYFDKYQDGTIDGLDNKRSTCTDTPLNIDTFANAVGLTDKRRVNVTVYELGTQTMADINGTKLTAGDKNPTSSVNSSQIVYMSGEKYRLEVKIW
jgi:hypothetical protein